MSSKVDEVREEIARAKAEIAGRSEEYREARLRHAGWIRHNLLKARKYRGLAAEANQKYNALKAAYQEQYPGRAEVLAALSADTEAQFAIADNVMYDRWATMYSALVSAEVAAYTIGVHPDPEVEL